MVTPRQRPHGSGTAAVARALEPVLAARGYDVLYGHGQAEPGATKGLGQIHTWYGDKLGRATMLADLDIAVVERASDRALVLIEVEETTDRAKVLLGDVIATLLGSGVAFRGRQLLIGQWTTLVVVAHLGSPARADRFPYLEEQVTALKGKLNTPNAAIGHVTLAGYTSQLRLEQLLMGYIQTAIG